MVDDVIMLFILCVAIYAHSELCAHYGMSGRVVQKNIQFKAGRIGSTVRRANTEAMNWLFSCTARGANLIKEDNNIWHIII